MGIERLLGPNAKSLNIRGKTELFGNLNAQYIQRHNPFNARQDLMRLKLWRGFRPEMATRKFTGPMPEP